MNLVMEKGRVLSTADLFVKMCELDQDLFYKIKPENLVEFIESRIAGTHCACEGDGVFDFRGDDFGLVRYPYRQHLLFQPNRHPLASLKFGTAGDAAPRGH